jgi:hypothetical protein
MDLDSSAWKDLLGGYKTPYNAARPLKKLRDTTERAETVAIFKELWENLHHQGDVGLASYLAVPQLVRICIGKNSLDWNYIGLCVLIENCRLESHNPELPSEFEDPYLDALAEFEKYLLINFKNITDQTALRFTLALFATVNGQPRLGKSIEKLDEDLLVEFLDRF